MTVIVYDGAELVSDSLMTMDMLKVPAAAKKIFTPEAHEYWEINGVKVLAFGFAGQYIAIPYVQELLQAGVTFRTVMEPEVDLSFDAICVLENGASYILSGAPGRGGKQNVVCIPIDPPLAVGSGSPYAYSMMEIGKKGRAQAAVKAAIKLDMGCGGELQVFTLPAVPEVLSKRPPAPDVVVTENNTKIGDMTLEQLTTIIKDVSRDHLIPPPTDGEETVIEKSPHVTH